MEPCLLDNVGCMVMGCLVAMVMMPWGVMVAMTPSTRHGITCLCSSGSLARVQDYRWPYLCVCAFVLVCVHVEGYVFRPVPQYIGKDKGPHSQHPCASVAMVTLIPFLCLLSTAISMPLKSHYISHIHHTAEV